MLDKKVLIPIVIGFAAIVTINFVFFENSRHQNSINNESELVYDLAVKENGFIVEEGKVIKKIEKVNYTVFKRVKNKFIEQREILVGEDLMENLFSTKILRNNAMFDFQSIKFQKIYSLADVDVLKAKENQFKNGFLGSFDVFIYQKGGTVQKIKFQTNEPFQIEDKRITEFKSYQIIQKTRIIRNSEVIYSVKNNTYKILITTAYSI